MSATCLRAGRRPLDVEKCCCIFPRFLTQRRSQEPTRNRARVEAAQSRRPKTTQKGSALPHYSTFTNTTLDARAQPAAHSRAQFQPRRAVCNGHCGCVTACSTPHSSGAAPAGPKGTLILTRVYPPSCAGYTNLCCFACVEQSALGFVTRFGRFVRFAEPGQAAARAPYPPASGAVTSPE